MTPPVEAELSTAFRNFGYGFRKSTPPARIDITPSPLAGEGRDMGISTSSRSLQPKTTLMCDRIFETAYLAVKLIVGHRLVNGMLDCYFGVVIPKLITSETAC
jgi:hypothetical protein